MAIRNGVVVDRLDHHEQQSTARTGRLAPDTVVDLLEKRLGNIRVAGDTTPLEAGYQLGVQDVLKALRNGF